MKEEAVAKRGVGMLNGVRWGPPHWVGERAGWRPPLPHARQDDRPWKGPKGKASGCPRHLVVWEREAPLARRCILYTHTHTHVIEDQERKRNETKRKK